MDACTVPCLAHVIIVILGGKRDCEVISKRVTSSSWGKKNNVKNVVHIMVLQRCSLAVRLLNLLTIKEIFSSLQDILLISILYLKNTDKAWFVFLVCLYFPLTI